MIGYTLKGTDVTGNSCEGVILDKVLIIQGVPVGDPKSIGRGQVMPIAADAYMIINYSTGTIHLIPPVNITSIIVPAKTVC